MSILHFVSGAHSTIIFFPLTFTGQEEMKGTSVIVLKVCLSSSLWITHPRTFIFTQMIPTYPYSILTHLFVFILRVACMSCYTHSCPATYSFWCLPTGFHSWWVIFISAHSLSHPLTRFHTHQLVFMSPQLFSFPPTHFCAHWLIFTSTDLFHVRLVFVLADSFLCDMEASKNWGS